MKSIFAAAALTAAFAAPGLAATPSGGLGGLSLSPDGTTLLAAGDNRVLYTIDASTYEVTGRMFMPAMPIWLDHSTDGSTVYVLDTDDVLTAHNAADMSRKWELDRVRIMDFNAEAQRIVYVKSSSKESDVILLDAANGAQLGSWKIPIAVQQVGLSDDAKTLAIISRSQRVDDEPKADKPDDLEGAAEETWRKQHDGYKAVLAHMSMEDGSVQQELSWYSASSFSDIRIVGDKTYFLKSSRDPMVMGPDFSVEILDMDRTNGDVSIVNPAGDMFVNGDGASLSLMPIAGGAPVTFKQDKLPGWFEDMMTFQFHEDGRIFGTTDGWRLIVVDPATNAKAAYPIY